MDLVLTKWIALKGTSVLASCRAEELSSRFPSVMIRDAAGFTCYLSTEREYQISGGYGAAAIYPLGKGGVLGGLWNMLEQINAGMEIDLRKIPIRQETVEICEFFDLNPYYIVGIQVKKLANLHSLLADRYFPKINFHTCIYLLQHIPEPA